MKVVSFYSGKDEYVKHSLDLTASFGNDVHFIGDNKIEGNFTYHDIAEFSEGLEEFKKVHIHTGPHPENVRWWGTARWFVFRNFMKKFGSPIFAIDADVMVFDDISKYFFNYKDCDYTYASYNTVCCIGQSFWINQLALDSLCDDMYSCYIDKDFNRETHHSDMTHATRLSIHNKFNAANTFLHNHPGYIDINMAMSNGFDMDDTFIIKKIEIINGQPYAFKDEIGSRFITLHCSGRAKSEIINYKNTSFQQRGL